MLEKKEKVLLKKAAAEVEKAKEFTRAKNKRGMSEITIYGVTKYMIYGFRPVELVVWSLGFYFVELVSLGQEC